MSKKKTYKAGNFSYLVSSASPNTELQLERCSMGQYFFEKRLKIAAFFYNTSMLGHKCSQDFWLGGGHKSRGNDVTRNFRKKNFLWTKIL